MAHNSECLLLMDFPKGAQDRTDIAVADIHEYMNARIPTQTK